MSKNLQFILTWTPISIVSIAMAYKPTCSIAGAPPVHHLVSAYQVRLNEASTKKKHIPSTV